MTRKPWMTSVVGGILLAIWIVVQRVVADASGDEATVGILGTFLLIGTMAAVLTIRDRSLRLPTLFSNLFSRELVGQSAVLLLVLAALIGTLVFLPPPFWIAVITLICLGNIMYLVTRLRRRG